MLNKIQSEEDLQECIELLLPLLNLVALGEVDYILNDEEVKTIELLNDFTDS